MTRDDDSMWIDRSLLTGAQYRTDANLAARQSIYAYQRPAMDLPSLVLELAGLHGDETVADVGCGNGVYLAELARRGQAGPVLGADLSAGMLQAAGGRAPGAGLVVADAAGLPLRDDACDLTLAMHMLYHVPDQEAVARELRRVTRPGGKVLVGLNGSDHLRELRVLINEALPAAGWRAGPADGAAPVVSERLNLDGGHELLAGVFTSVTRHDFTAELLLPGPEPVEAYLRSMIITQELPEPESFAAAVLSRIPAGRDGVFRVRTHSGCLVCS